MGEAEKNTAKVVVSGQENSKRFWQNKIIWIAGAAILILVITGGYRVVQKPKKPTKTGNTVKLSNEDLINQVNSLNASKKYSEAKQLIQDSAQSPKSEQALELVASTEYNAGNYKQSLADWLNIAKNFSLTANIASNVAYAASKTGDKQLAIDYFNKAIDLANKSKYIAYQADVKAYQVEINNLKK